MILTTSVEEKGLMVTIFQMWKLRHGAVTCLSKITHPVYHRTKSRAFVS